MEYKGYTARVEFDEDAEVLHGRVLNIKDVITFEADSVEALKREFEASVDDYLAFCEARGEDPDKPFSGTFTVRITPELHREATLYAELSGSSLNSWVTEAIKDTLQAAHMMVRE